MKLRKLIGKLVISLALMVFLGLPVALEAQDTNTISNVEPNVTYEFKTVEYPDDNYTQLLGINNRGEIVGYHGSGQGGHPNKGFTFRMPNNFAPETVPNSTQNGVTGINDQGETAGFYIDAAGVEHGFLNLSDGFKTVDFPAKTFGYGNQLSGLNTASQAVGSYEDVSGNFHAYIYERLGGVFLVFTVPKAFNPVATFVQATGINNAGEVSGIYVDTAGLQHGFLLTKGYFKTLDFPGAGSTAALGLNNLGQVVGNYSTDAFTVHGFVWTDGKGFQTVDDPDGVGQTSISGINDKGVAVGFYGVNCALIYGSPGGVCKGFVASPQLTDIENAH